MDARDYSFAKGLLLTAGGGLAIALVIAAAVWVAGRDSGESSGTATATAAGESQAATSRAPAFTLSQLAAEPADDWITNGGSL